MTPSEFIKAVYEEGDIFKDFDGYYKYWPSNEGAFQSWHLRAIADELDARNRDWDATVNQELTKPLPSVARWTCQCGEQNIVGSGYCVMCGRPESPRVSF